MTMRWIWIALAVVARGRAPARDTAFAAWKVGG
jgi:hypothetical protein